MTNFIWEYEVIAEFVRDLAFFATEGRPVFRIVSNNLHSGRRYRAR